LHFCALAFGRRLTPARFRQRLLRPSHPDRHPVHRAPSRDTHATRKGHAKGSTLFQLRADHNGVFDGSNAGIAIQRAANVKALPGLKPEAIASSTLSVAISRAWRPQ